MDSGLRGNDGWTIEGYFAVLEECAATTDERCELLDGIIVAAPQQGPVHAGGMLVVAAVLHRAFDIEVPVASQLPLVCGDRSVPEPDFAVLPGRRTDYLRRRPDSALLVVEVADRSLLQDRLTKSRIYAGAGVPDCWIVNLRDRVVEWFADPDRELRVYRSRGISRGHDRLPLSAFGQVTIRAGDLIPAGEYYV